MIGPKAGSGWPAPTGLGEQCVVWAWGLGDKKLWKSLGQKNLQLELSGGWWEWPGGHTLLAPALEF